MFSSNCSSYFFVVLHCLPALFLVYFSIFCLRFSFITNSYVVIIAWASFCVAEQYNQYDMYMLCFSSVFLKHGICGVIWFIKTSTQISLCSCIIYFLSFLSVRFLFLENEEVKSSASPCPSFFPMHCSDLLFFLSHDSISYLCSVLKLSSVHHGSHIGASCYFEVVTMQVSHWQVWVRRDCRCSMFSWFGELVEFWRRSRRHGKRGRKITCCKSNGKK